MEEGIAPTPKPNEFKISAYEAWQAYAMTHIEVCAVAEFLMAKLEPVNLEGLNDRICTICQEEFLVSEDVRRSHIPAKLACGHIFGRDCIIRWFDPFCRWGINHEHEDNETALAGPINGRTSCPMCRKRFFPPCEVEKMDELANRLLFWDMAYASAGVARSPKEERSHKYLWQYIEYCCSMDGTEPEAQRNLVLQKGAQKQLLRYAKKLKYQTLTPELETIRSKLERIGRKDLEKCAFENGSYVFNIDRDDNERIEFEGNPL